MSQDRAATTFPQSASSQEHKCCILCGNKGTQLSNYSNWGAIEKEFLHTHLDRYPPEGSYICKKHWIEAQRHHTNSHYIPKWKEVHTQEPQKCCIHPQCCNKFHEKLIKPAFANITELEELLEVQSSTDNPFLLCPTCYTKLYRQFNPVLNCTSCRAIPKHGQKFCRHSPNSTIVSQYLKDTTGTDVVISPDDWICTNCYNTHCTIIKSIECNQIGSNEMLAKAIEEWETTTAYNIDKLTKAILSSVVFVAKYLLAQKALLLPWACHVFLQVYNVQYTDIKSVQVSLELKDSSVQFSSRWLLHQLIVHLDAYMMHKCVHMKYGTVLYRKGADILATLSWALSTSNLAGQWSKPEKQKQHDNYPNAETTLKEASIIMNNLIHDEIKRSVEMTSTLDYNSLKIKEHLKNINPLLLDFLTSTTNTIREREISDTTKHIKKIRLYFILCQLMFCTNPKIPTPIHNLIADLIEVCGGSRQLIRILNRLGCASSPDTHDRYVTQHAMAQRQSTVWNHIPNNVFTIASVDNFDMLQSYAAVYCGDQQRSYHGTTMQLVQPNANLVLPCTQHSLEQSVRVTRQPDINLRNPQLQPPEPKRQRTVSIKNLTSTLQASYNTMPTVEPTVLTLDSFPEDTHQGKERCILQNKLFSYILQKYAFHHHHDTDAISTDFEATLSELRVFLDDQSDCSVTHSSTVHYMELVDENPDCMETMSLVAEDLLAKFDAVQDGWVILVGDGKSYRHLMNIKKQYSTALRKLLIFPGDWHIMKNYQTILMKVYYSAGLRELAKNSGYHGTTLKSIEQCSNFKRTHYFLLQTWEAMYRELLHVYITNTGTTITKDASCILLSSIQTKNSPKNVLKRISELVQDSQSEKEFMKFVKQMGDTDKTWRFWAQFIFTDCFCYFSLYLAVRSSNWHLRLASLKQMAPMFAAFDREYYARILPHHLAEVQCYPSTVLNCLQNGGFTVNLTEQHWRAVALDEAHEMCINKDLKTAVIRPTKSYLQKTSLFFNHRIKLYKNLIQQLFPECLIHQTKPTNILDDSPQAYRYEQNVKEIGALVVANHLFCVQPNGRDLLNVFTGQLATNEQSCDMLSFRQVGEQAFKNYVKYHILQCPSSAKVPLRKHKLMTMATSRTRKTRSTPKEREAKQVITCLRRRLAWLSHNEQPHSVSEEQYSELPRALSDEDGNPHKGNKSAWTDKLASRYLTADPPVFTTSSTIIPQVAIIDAMFIINTRPLRQTKTFLEYAHFLFNQFILQHYKAGTSEVHLIFDKVCRQLFNPKRFEHVK